MKRICSEREVSENDTQFKDNFDQEDINPASNYFLNSCQVPILNNEINCETNSIIKRRKGKWHADEDFLLIRQYIEHGPNWTLFTSLFNNRGPKSIKSHFYLLRNRMTMEQMELLNHQILLNRKKRDSGLIYEKLKFYENDIKDYKNKEPLDESKALKVWNNDIKWESLYESENEKILSKIFELKIKEALLENQLFAKKRELSEYRKSQGFIEDAF
ncbi:unnamed protein product [Blepharisma stoltei]|uniref:HTH myb-type domain-containing protein n=1 Tax=Blepharisma stoltei TaxID=1481888 RepID=A0AAU9IM10_9CILI|nr:unnamed protein product [Blepharisma stoltei]